MPGRLTRFFVAAACAVQMLGGCRSTPDNAAAVPHKAVTPPPTAADTLAEMMTPKPPFIERLVWAGRQAQMMKDSTLARGFRAALAPLERYRHAPLMEKMKAVDYFADTLIRVAEDSAAYGADEYFSPPANTVRTRKGDCDEFSTLKYEALKALGVDEKRMFLLMVAHKGDRTLDHVVLGVDLSPAGDKSQTVILDNLGPSQRKRGEVVPFYKTKYRPMLIYSPTGGMSVVE